MNLYRAAFSINGICVFRFSPTITEYPGSGAEERPREFTIRIFTYFLLLFFLPYNRRLSEYRAQLFAIVCCYLSYNIIPCIHIILYIHTYGYANLYVLLVALYWRVLFRYEIRNSWFFKNLFIIYLPIYTLLAFLS